MNEADITNVHSVHCRTTLKKHNFSVCITSKMHMCYAFPEIWTSKLFAKQVTSGTSLATVLIRSNSQRELLFRIFPNDESGFSRKYVHHSLNCPDAANECHLETCCQRHFLRLTLEVETRP